MEQSVAIFINCGCADKAWVHCLLKQSVISKANNLATCYFMLMCHKQKRKEQKQDQKFVSSPKTKKKEIHMTTHGTAVEQWLDELSDWDTLQVMRPLTLSGQTTIT